MNGVWRIALTRRKADELDPRERLLQTAQRLFGEQGIHATGIDRIIAEAGVAKMTLYKHFAGKDELVVAALRRKHEVFREFFRAIVESRQEPRGRLLAVFEAQERWFARPDFRGCYFLNAAAELPEANCAARRAVAEHKLWVLGQFQELCRGVGAPEPDRLADELMLLFEGAIARAYVTGDATAARAARRAAAALLEADLPAHRA
ncbi:MAG: TetR/AcrR family transcriptional regulator [Phycisphaerales bacterium]|nr:TetR/AcrR family transcriptional regulator [Phycisphaerales bacterium]